MQCLYQSGGEANSDPAIRSYSMCLSHSACVQGGLARLLLRKFIFEIAFLFRIVI